MVKAPEQQSLCKSKISKNPNNRLPCTSEKTKLAGWVIGDTAVSSSRFWQRPGSSWPHQDPWVWKENCNFNFGLACHHKHLIAMNNSCWVMTISLPVSRDSKTRSDICLLLKEFVSPKASCPESLPRAQDCDGVRENAPEVIAASMQFRSSEKLEHNIDVYHRKGSRVSVRVFIDRLACQVTAPRVQERSR